MCAMMPMLRTTVRSVVMSMATWSFFPYVLIGTGSKSRRSSSPTVVSERLVGLGHLVGVLALLHAAAETVRGVEELVHQPLRHRLLAALAGVLDDPAKREGGRAAGADLHGNLVRRATDAATAYLEARLDVVERTLERDDGVRAGLLACAFERGVDDPLGDLLLAVHQDLGDQLGHQRAAVDGVDLDVALRCGSLARHISDSPSSGSGRRSGASARTRLIAASALLLLRAVAAAGLLAVLHTLGVERAANDLVTDTGEVLHPAPAHENDRVLLQVVPDAGDVRGDLDAAAQLDACNLAQRGVRLLWRRGVHTGTNAATLRRTLQGRCVLLRHLVLTALADQLLDRGHYVLLSSGGLLSRRSE